MKYKGIIFDLDGVICSTDQYHYEAWKMLADKIEVYFDKVINQRLRGVSREASLDIILENSEKEYSYEEKQDFLKIKNNYYKLLLEKMTPAQLDDDVKKTLDALKEKNIRMAIGSSSKNTSFILSRLGLDNYFDAVSDGMNITKSKPDPEVFIKAANMLKLKPQDCLIVEDALAGVEAALKGRFDCAGINIANTHPDVTFQLDSFSDLLKYIL